MYCNICDGDEFDLKQCLEDSKSKFILSTWLSTKYRKNEYVETLWNNYNIVTKEHFYHLGANEENRNSVTEALIYNY